MIVEYGIDAICEALGVPPAAATLVEQLQRKWSRHQTERVILLLKNVGEEFVRGESEEDWRKLYDRIDEQDVHSTVVDATRMAIDAFDEAVIPYLAKVVSWHLAVEAEPLTRRKTRWLLKLLSECDYLHIKSLEHIVQNSLEHWDAEEDHLTLFVQVKDSNSKAFLRVHGNVDNKKYWLIEKHDYPPVFEILKNNYYGTEAAPGFGGLATNSYLVELKKEDLNILERVLFTT